MSAKRSLYYAIGIVVVAVIIAIASITPATSGGAQIEPEKPKGKYTLEELRDAKKEMELKKAPKTCPELNLKYFKNDFPKVLTCEELIDIQKSAIEQERINRYRFPLKDYTYITSSYGMRCNVEGVYEGCDFHDGLDFGVYNEGDWTLFPVTSGEITYVYTEEQALNTPYSGCGNYVVIYYPALDVSTVYCHMSTLTAAVGDKADPDVSVGLVGTTGMSNGNHLHLMFVSGRDPYNRDNLIEPYEYLRELKVIS